MATVGELLDETSRIIERGEEAFPNLEKLVRGQIPLYLKQAPYRINDHYFLEITVSDAERSFLFYKRVCRSSTVKELKEMLFMRYAVPPSEQAWVFHENILEDAKKLSEVGMDKVAMFCPVHVRVFQKFTWPTYKVETKASGAWTCGRCKMQNWQAGSECANCARVKEGKTRTTRDRRSRAELSDQPRDLLTLRSADELKEEGDVRVKDMAPSLIEKMGWTCPTCTMVNNPTRPGCEMCASPRPTNYRPPSKQALDTARQNSIGTASGDSIVRRVPKAPKPTWACHVCENVNPMNVSVCRACTVDRYENVTPQNTNKNLKTAPVKLQNQRSITPPNYHDDLDYGDSMSLMSTIGAAPPQSLPPNPREEARAARIRDLIKESFGWKCGTCATTNEPGELRCVECQSKRPFNYKVPTERERQNLIATIPNDVLEPPSPPPKQQKKGISKESQDCPEVGWACPQCSYVNRPRRPGCEMCGGEPPPDYDLSQAADDPEEEERIRVQRENERRFIENEEKRHQDELRKMEDAMNMDMVTPDKEFECPVCICDQEPNDGIRLRNCLHDLCKDCLTGAVQNDESGDIKCSVCGAQIDDRDIKNVVPQELWERRNMMLLKLNEACIENSFHCLTTDCEFFVEIVDEVNEFECPICKKKNCITCKAQHQDETCEQYQERLKLEARNNENARLTLEMFERMIQDGEAMRCPKCSIVLQKKEGCDWLRCTGCRTELCWATKGFRWGPNGKGDISGGCRCRVNGKPCVPECRNCH